jgi:hypothetical protein
MADSRLSVRLVAQEARALLTRLARVKPYALNMPMVPAAAVSPQAQSAIEQHMLTERKNLEKFVWSFLAWLESPIGLAAPTPSVQRRFTLLRLRFNAVLTQFEIFADVLVQRSEHGTGVWVSGLDSVAADALGVVAPFVAVPPVICHLDRGIGAAIRRARTRLPGGDENPVGIIRIPRERMVGSGIASSLVHEAGHQGAALIDLVESLRRVLIERQKVPQQRRAWRFWDRWISEIVADLWSIGHLGLTATQGLLAVVSLPRAFMFRISEDDPHPFPWFRVKLGCAIGAALYPHPQWGRMAAVWEELYPRQGLDAEQSAIIAELEVSMPEFVTTLLDHRPAKLRGLCLRNLFPVRQRGPGQLIALFQESRRDRGLLYRIYPTLAFAVLGQARAEDLITPEQESESLALLLTHWAVRSSLDTSILCASASVQHAEPARSA